MLGCLPLLPSRAGWLTLSQVASTPHFHVEKVVCVAFVGISKLQAPRYGACRIKGSNFCPLREVEAVVDTLTRSQRSERMSRIRGKDTVPELIVRRFLHSKGYRYRLHRKSLPGKPDVVLSGLRAVLFVDGCFWHGHRCQQGRLPATNTDFWKSKLETNKSRDRRNRRKLRSLGWRVIRVWECRLHSHRARRLTLERLISELTPDRR